MAPYKPAQPSLSTTMTVHPSPPNPLDRAWGGKARARWRRKAISEELLPPQPRDALASNHGVIYRSIPAPNEKVLALKVGWPVDTDTVRAPQGLPAVLASRPPSRPTSNLLGPLKPQPNSCRQNSHIPQTLAPLPPSRPIDSRSREPLPLQRG